MVANKAAMEMMFTLFELVEMETTKTIQIILVSLYQLKVVDHMKLLA